VPVWNGLTDTWHPIQMLADVLTMTDHCGKPLAELSFCYLGEGRSNTANSLLVTGATLGMDARICAPAGLQPSAEIRGIAAGLAAGSGARLLVTEDVNTGVAEVDFVYTDVWLSLGEPEDQWDTRIDQLLPYQVNAVVLKATGNPAVKFLHCLPALHNRDTESASGSTLNAGWTPWKSPTRSSNHPLQWCSTRPRSGCTRSRPS
jgi:ornithine carbamoyltransferase